MTRYACLHGHFYQPPRENPWTGEIDPQPSAAPDRDWNVRVARECYLPNGAARIMGGSGETKELVNNYAYLSFDFGPTLLSWYEKAHPEGYAKLLEADKESAARLGGHGNALAHPYAHAILPLAEHRDARTLIRWGLEDFRHRFGREPEALWLPEAAVNEMVLRALIERGLSYAVLAPAQAQAVRACGASEWKDVSDGSIDSRRPYRWFDRASESGRFIDLFFYHGALSHGVAFDKIMADSKACARRVCEAFGPAADQLISIATDGESYGHHEKFSDMGLAHLVKYDLAASGVELVNYGLYLEKHPPSFEVAISPGPKGHGTSWSCAHGVARWMEECSCGAEGGQTRWRGPLRRAIDALNDRLGEAFERAGEALFKDPWEARDAFIPVVLKPALKEAFLAERLKARADRAAGGKAMALLEMQRQALLMQTSCAWFFADPAGIETVQCLRHAARAVDLAREACGEDLEPGFLSDLRAVASNDPSRGDGAQIYRSAARPPRGGA